MIQEPTNISDEVADRINHSQDWANKSMEDSPHNRGLNSKQTHHRLNSNFNVSMNGGHSKQRDSLDKLPFG
jgi:hypothetical protein